MARLQMQNVLRILGGISFPFFFMEGVTFEEMTTAHTYTTKMPRPPTNVTPRFGGAGAPQGQRARDPGGRL